MNGNRFINSVMGLALMLAGVQAATAQTNLPLVIPDPSQTNWVVDRFLGNSTTGQRFYPGPATEVGGFYEHATAHLVLSNGTVLVIGSHVGLVEVATNGMTQLLMGKNGLVEGPMERCQYGVPYFVNPKDGCVYLDGPNCLRRITQRGGTNWVEVVAGIPNTTGTNDGPALAATMNPFKGLVCDSQGTIYFGSGYKIRRLKDDVVTTMTFDTSFAGGASFEIFGGKGDGVLILALSSEAYTLDLATLTTTHLYGVRLGTEYASRRGSNADGPATTHASHNSALTSILYDPFHDALWISGADEEYFRWLKMDAGSDGWVRSVFGGPGTGFPLDAFNVPGTDVRLMWCHVYATDSKGRVYLSGVPNSIGDTSGIWRGYNKNEVVP